MAIDNLETLEKSMINLADSEATELKNSVLETRLSEYEEVIRDIKNQIIPTEDLKSKIDSLDQDVICLRRKLQCRGSFKYNKKTALLPSKANKRKSLSKVTIALSLSLSVKIEAFYKKKKNAVIKN